MAKGHDHEIVRAAEIHPKARPWKLKLNFVWLCAFKCSDIRDWALNQIVFRYHPTHFFGPSTQ